MLVAGNISSAATTKTKPAEAVSTNKIVDTDESEQQPKPYYMLEEMNKIRYTQTKDREKSAVNLLTVAKANMQKDPSQSNKTVYAAILAFVAGEKGGLKGLSLAKESYKLLHEVVSSDEPSTLDGYAYTTLGALYLNVPSWPIGFGSLKKAKDMIDKAIAKDPNNIDANFYLAKYYIAKRNMQKARVTLEKVTKTNVRKFHTIGDSGRKKEAQKLLSTLK